MRFHGTRGDDDFVGTSADDIFYIRHGNDRVTGGGGRDQLLVNYSAQTNVSYAYDHILIGEDGSLSGTLYGNDRSSVDFQDIDSLRFTGSGARDLVTVQMNGDPRGQSVVLDAGGGEDVLTLIFNGTTSKSVFIVGEENLIYSQAGFFTNFERCFVYFGDGNDFAMGGPNADYFFGRAGNDDFFGGGGDDFLYAGPGADFLTGGTGADTIYYFSPKDSRPGAPDEISDFSHADGDIINLDRIDADKTVPRNQHFTFIDQAAFTGPGGLNGELRQQINGDGTVTLQGDVNHDGIADFAILVTTDEPLVAADFRL